MPPPSAPPASRSVSVVIGTYNGARFIDAQLQSIASQTLQPSELIVSDDGSSDETAEIVGQFARNAGFPVRFRRNAQKLGFGENFLSASMLARSELVAFCDQDDVWMPQKLEQGCAPFCDERVAMTTHQARLVDASLADLGLFEQGITANATWDALTLDPWGCFAGFTTVFRRSLLDLFPIARRCADINRREPATTHDRWIYFLASSLGRVVTLAEPLALYRQHNTNLYGGRRSSRWTAIRTAIAQSGGLRDRCKHFADVAAVRAAILQEIAEKSASKSSLRASASSASAYWAQISRAERARESLHSETGIAGRVLQLAHNFSHGVYRTASQEGFRWTTAGRDALGLLYFPYFRRDHPAPAWRELGDESKLACEDAPVGGAR
jgi:hypothetical protein